MFIPVRAYQWPGPVFWVIPTGTIGIRARGRLDQASALSEKSLDQFSDRRVYSHTLNGHSPPNRMEYEVGCPKKVRFMDKLRYGYCRVSRAADDLARNLDTQQQALEAAGIRPELIYRDVASGGSLDRQGWNALVDVVRPGDTITVSRLDRIGRNLVEGLQAIERLTEQGVGIVALDAGIDTSAANPAARLQIAMMLAFAEWERQTVRERSIAGQQRAPRYTKLSRAPEGIDRLAAHYVTPVVRR